MTSNNTEPEHIEMTFNKLKKKVDN